MVEASEQYAKKPKPSDLNKLLSCIYGVDKEEQATKLTAFSLCLALCDTLSPMQVISELKFVDLTKNNILYTDFFIDELILPKEEEKLKEYSRQIENFNKVKSLKFSLIVGNPPFARSGKKIEGRKDFWDINYNNKRTKIPSNQIALKFLWKSTGMLKEDGLQCLILKASSFLYNPTSFDFKKLFFSIFNVAQIFDFTPLARNKSLWDNGADVDTIALFTKNTVPETTKNILHAIFRRTKVNRERILFEIDDADLNYISRNQAINNPFIWKANLVGGGRVSVIVDKLTKKDTLLDFLENNGLVAFEGEGGAKSLNNEAFHSDYIDDSFSNELYKKSFKNLENTKFHPPNFLVKENISLPFALNKKKIPFSNEVICISGKEDRLNELEIIKDFFVSNEEFIKFFLLATSGKALVYKNTSFKKDDLLRVPFFYELQSLLNEFDIKIISDVNNYFQFFLRNGEKSKAVQRISKNEIQSVILSYGNEFSKILNLLYQEKDNQFRLSKVNSFLGGAYLMCVFEYDDDNKEVSFTTNQVEYLQSLTEFEITKHLSSKRIIRLYNIKDTIIIIKPNQYRYWMSLSAYRDADKSIFDLTKMGY
ncbi:hypothetical protein P8625_15130 [Tenacibaculum tangerinum]|uniref:site-specific DNA-methyltransferase (adenine-specific) n=1 Tax=Tenacibaculum tangerinum TaxID=3038772 RepID=A0ABY8L202_9FLAO|nr:hypothetical protein [Tenacibaculum tangerinum]WGH75385.1 hypothetical protein P8625_15130 [Tenacibaculum tangerinum]